ncbi:hypothetical protein [Phormidesmis priestleyi]|nr:hypothetical protein [Phormidesmis priestleyi]
MKLLSSEYVTLVEVLGRTRSFEEFSTIAQAAVQRLESEGVRALVSIQFYANPDSIEVGAILTFADRAAMMQHINMITAWEEFKQFFSSVKPIDVRVYGKLSVEAEAWVRQFNVVSKTFENHLTGFVR